jgi:hypothetical protein
MTSPPLMRQPSRCWSPTLAGVTVAAFLWAIIFAQSIDYAPFVHLTWLDRAFGDAPTLVPLALLAATIVRGIAELRSYRKQAIVALFTAVALTCTVAALFIWERLWS